MNREPVFLLPPIRRGVFLRPSEVKERVDYNHNLHGIPEAWKASKGEGIKIGILDTGVPEHADLQGQIFEGANFTGDAIEDKVQGHATHVAGIIAAKEDGRGIVGVAPQSKLMCVKVLDDSGAGLDEWLAGGIRKCVDSGCDIINMSLGAPAQFEAHFPLTKHESLAAFKQGVVLFAASGNESATRVGVPARWPWFIAVAAINKQEAWAEFSNIGRGIDFAGAGVDVLSCVPSGGYESWSGTSMATPDLVGLAALIMAKHRDDPGDTPINSPKDVYEHLKRISRPAKGVQGGQGGYSTSVGWGVPVVHAAARPELEEGGRLVDRPKAGWSFRELKDWLHDMVLDHPDAKAHLRDIAIERLAGIAYKRIQARYRSLKGD